VNEIITAFAFTVSLFATLVILFVPKVLSLYRGEEVESKLKMSQVAAKVYHEEDSFRTNKLVDACTKALKSRSSLDDKHALCMQQLDFWKTMLMAIDEKRSSDTGSGSGSAAVSSTSGFSRLEASSVHEPDDDEGKSHVEESS
jgi:hypothetical protein